ncbi:MAG: hypothetical protein ABIH46_00330 [Chloroflexota bacterium]
MSKDLVKLEWPKIDVEAIKAKYPNHYYILPPSDAQLLSPLHKLDLRVVRLSVGKACKIGGEYRGGEWVDLYMYSKVQLREIATMAGIKITNPVILTNKENIFEHQVTVSYILPTGDVAVDTPTKTMDFRLNGSRANRSRQQRRERIQNALDGKKFGGKTAQFPKGLQPKQAGESLDAFWDRANKWIEQEVEKEMVDARVFGQELAGTGAALRGIRGISSLPMQMTAEEIETPILIGMAKMDYGKYVEYIGAEEVMRRLQAAAFASLSGPDTHPDEGLVKVFASFDDLSKDDVVAAETIEIEPQFIKAPQPPVIENGVFEELDFDEEEPPAEEAVSLVQYPPIMGEPISEEKRGKLRQWMAYYGYDSPYAQDGCIKAIFGTDISHLDTLAGKIICQYVALVDTKAKANKLLPVGERATTDQFKHWKDAHKARCRHAYLEGMDLDQFANKG